MNRKIATTCIAILAFFMALLLTLYPIISNAYNERQLTKVHAQYQQIVQQLSNSISVGIQNLADCLHLADVESPIDLEHIQLALQGYNYGSGYISWAKEKYGGYSRANAIEFSMKMAEQMGWNSYGDKQYVPHVLRYYPIGRVFYTPEGGDAIVDVALTQVGNVGGEPYWSWYGFENHVEWCACFVSWCADQCGYLTDGSYPKFSGCVFGMQWFQQRGLCLYHRGQLQ